MVNEILEAPALQPDTPTLHRQRTFCRDPYPLALAAIVVLAAILRIYGISFKSFWMDEAMSIRFSTLSWPQFARVLWNREANMTVYYLMLRFWLVFGRSEGFLRGLSVIFSVGTVPILYALGKRLFDQRTGLLAAFLLSINAFHVRYAQEARSYALVMFLAVLASWLLVRNIQEPYAANWAAYMAVCVLGVYSHFYFGLVVVAHLIALTLFPRVYVPWKTIALHISWFSALMVPIAILVLRTGTGPISWLQPLTWKTFLYFGFDFAGNYGRPLLILTVLAIGLALLASSPPPSAKVEPMEAWPYQLAAIWLFLPVTIVGVTSIFHPLFIPRYLSPCLPALALLMAAGIAGSRPRAIGWLLFVPIIICSILGVRSYYRGDFDLNRENWRYAASYVFSHSQPGDSIFFYQSAGELGFEYYRWQRNPSPVWPKTLNPPMTANEKEVDSYPMISGTDIRVAGPADDRVWLILLLPVGANGMPDMMGYKVRDWFAAGRHRIDVQRLSPINIVLFAKDSPQRDSVPPQGP